MKRVLFLILVFLAFSASAQSFTVCSYNCGGLSDHYDYIRAAVCQLLMEERFELEPQLMEQIAEIEKMACCGEVWDANLYHALTLMPNEKESCNKKWHELYSAAITPYNERPIKVYDKRVSLPDDLCAARLTLAKQIFSKEIDHDIIALQETNYLDESVFPKEYEVVLVNDLGLAWKKERFCYIDTVAVLSRHALVIHLKDLENDKDVLVASAHLTGCNPYQGGDSEQGDEQLQDALKVLRRCCGDIKVIAMDSNVTACHPRLNLLADYGYKVDQNSDLEATCTNPYTLLNNRLDWIAILCGEPINIPVDGVDLNNPKNNFSDHKPIAARIVSTN